MPWEPLRADKKYFLCLLFGKEMWHKSVYTFKMMENLFFNFHGFLTTHCIQPYNLIIMVKKFLTLNLCLKTENVMLNHLIAWLIINYASCMPKLSVQYNFVKVSFVVKRIINIFWWILDSKTPFQYLFCLIVSQCQQLGSHHHQPVGQSNKPGVIIHWVQTRVVHRNIWNVSYKMFILRIYYYDRGVILKLLLC